MQDAYFTIGKSASHEIKIKGSRFIGFAEHAKDHHEAERLIRVIRKEHHHATHNCYAYRIGIGSTTQFKFNDDGEPSGTAGRPILDIMEGRQVTYSVCIVTRYFGGVKLGTGGLARAYAQCTAETLARAKIVQKFLMDSISLQFDYRWMGTVMLLVSRYHCQIMDTQYGEKTTMIVQLQQSLVDEFREALTDQTAGQIRVSEPRSV